MMHDERPLPGTVVVADTHFIYIEATRGELDLVLDGIVAELQRMERVPRGGIGSQNVELVLPDQTPMQAFSYRVDTDLWRAGVATFCVKSGRRCGVIRGEELVLQHNGESVRVDACSVRYYQR